MSVLLDLKELSVQVVQDRKKVPLLHEVSLQIFSGEILGCVGESGSGKSLTALAMMRLLPTPPMQVTEGMMLWQGHLEPLEGISTPPKGMAMVFQNPMSAFNPVHRLERQIGEVPFGSSCTKMSVSDKADLLAKMGIEDPYLRLRQYPHELSGGIAQRAFIAMALAQRPKLLIADEATSALDPEVQKEVSKLLLALRHEMGLSILFITHDLPLAASIADRVCVMHHGRVVEQAPASKIFTTPKHPYTRQLVEASQ